MANLLKRYLKFISTGVVGTLVDTLVLWIFSDFVFRNGYWKVFIISPIISFQCAVAVNFILSYFYIWRDRTMDWSDAQKQRSLKLFLAYDLSCSAVFLLRLGAMLLIEKFTGWDVVICNLLAMFFSGILNFTIENLLIFRKKNSQSSS